MSKKILITGTAGFIGFHAVFKFLKEGYKVVGLDNINDYYATSLKFDRLKICGIDKEDIKWNTLVQSKSEENYRFIRLNLEDKYQIFELFREEKFDYVINLAAQAGVRYSIENPDTYIQSNVVGFQNILEACRKYPVKHIVHASSSSVYGSRSNVPFSESDQADSPVSLYAATKRSNELMAYSYSHLYDIPISCLRFFTVYGPWGRPDMAPMLFATAVSQGKPIKVFNNGEMERDFTYIDDIVSGVFEVSINIPSGTPKYKVLNIGNGAPVKLTDFISVLEGKLCKVAVKNMMPMQAGDVVRTYANQDEFVKITGYKPKIGITEGVANFVEWFKEYYKY